MKTFVNVLIHLVIFFQQISSGWRIMNISAPRVQYIRLPYTFLDNLSPGKLFQKMIKLYTFLDRPSSRDYNTDIKFRRSSTFSGSVLETDSALPAVQLKSSGRQKCNNLPREHR